ncbi:Permease of the drug/metabolite transporter (DMT) superfamily [Tranquillimonas rosea]|uniref:Permease of the drug/metabolite transporter (DMT) superfamily n=1 Tax=Tranquillimonas rosea TaxID=641238 RepID=A0A1H9THF3_9RHOB|nr:DMT family transporter [Tranquillimonas rosea]SER96404.1 Permease of the drug/metabolite transporter (DMT) superfamily [Tranquillimonas rosea]
MENLRGIVLMVAAMAGFAVEDAIIKAVSSDLPIGQILMILGTIGGIAFSIMARAQGARVLSRDAIAPPVLLRHLGEIVCTAGFVTAISLLPLASTSAILQATPLAVTLGAALFLGEPVGWRRWTAIAAGFAGVLMVVRPGLAGFEPASILAVIAVFGLALRDLATRRVPSRISTTVLAAYGFIAIVPTGAVLLAITGGGTAPSAGNLAALACASVVGLSGYYAITAAMRVGEVAVVTPFRYARLLFALILGMTFFAERPDALTLAGAALIIGSGLYTLVRERQALRARRRGLSSAAPLP